MTKDIDLRKVNELLKGLGHDFDSNTPFIHEKGLSEEEVDELNKNIFGLFELVYESMDEYWYVRPPFHEEKNVGIFHIYIKVDGIQYIIISLYGSCIREYTDIDAEVRKVKYYLDIDTNNSNKTEVKVMGSNW